MGVQLDYSHMMAANLGVEHGIREADLDALQPVIDRIHAEIEADKVGEQHELYGYMDLPDTMRALVPELREAAEQFKALGDAHVILGIGGSYLGARMLFESLCHTFHNELPAEKRGGWPRIYFEGNGLDNDAFRDLLDRLAGEPLTVHVVSKSGSTLETAMAFRVLRQECGSRIRGYALTTDPDSRLRRFCVNRGFEPLRVFPLPSNVGGRYSVLTPVGLFPAAMMGLDIEKLLDGAAAMREICRAKSLHKNPAYLYAALQHLSYLAGRDISVMAVWHKKLEAFGLWYDQLCAESLGKDEKGRTPLTAVCTRELHSRGQQHQEGQRDKVICNLIAQRPDREALYGNQEQGDVEEAAAYKGGKPSAAQLEGTDGMFFAAGNSLHELNEAAYKATDTAYAKALRPGMTFTLPQIDEHVIGQMIYLFELATIAEGKLMAVNPINQPGVQAYKDFIAGLLDKPGGEAFAREYEVRRGAHKTYELKD